MQHGWNAGRLPAERHLASAGSLPAIAQTTSHSLHHCNLPSPMQVVSALGERSSRALSATTSAAPPDAALPEAAGLPPWLVHWRLRVALSSQQLFTEASTTQQPKPFLPVTPIGTHSLLLSPCFLLTLCASSPNPPT